MSLIKTSQQPCCDHLPNEIYIFKVSRNKVFWKKVIHSAKGKQHTCKQKIKKVSGSVPEIGRDILHTFTPGPFSGTQTQTTNRTEPTTTVRSWLWRSVLTRRSTPGTALRHSTGTFFIFGFCFVLINLLRIGRRRDCLRFFQKQTEMAPKSKQWSKARTITEVHKFQKSSVSKVTASESKMCCVLF